MTTTTTIVTGGKASARRSTRRVEPIDYFFLVPTLVLFKEGKAVDGAIGALSKQEVRNLVEPHLSKAA